MLLQQLTRYRCCSSAAAAAAAAASVQPAMQQRLRRLGSAATGYTRAAASLLQLRQQQAARRGCSSSSSSSSRVQIDRAARTVSVQLPDTAQTSVFPIAWLRDSCQCSSCFHPVTLSRVQLMENFNPGIDIASVQIDEAKEQMHVIWSDNHISDFNFNWLRLRSFDPEAQSRRMPWYSGKHELWGSEHSIPHMQYDQIQQSDTSLLEFLNELERHGLCILEGAPSNGDAALGTVLELCNRVAYPLQNNYGDTFEVKSKVNPSNLAYTPARLGLHVDLPFYRELPGVQILHCISQSGNIVGGENFFSDGFHAANILKRSNPTFFDILASTRVDFYDYGSDFLKDFHLLFRQRVISVNSDGEYDMICYNNQVRDTYLNIPVEKVQGFYDALKEYDRILNGNECAVFTKLREGDIVIFDNRRVLHGRNSYTVKGNAERHLQGAYLRWDEVYSRIRRLEESVRGKQF